MTPKQFNRAKYLEDRVGEYQRIVMQIRDKDYRLSVGLVSRDEHGHVSKHSAAPETENKILTWYQEDMIADLESIVITRLTNQINTMRAEFEKLVSDE